MTPVLPGNLAAILFRALYRDFDLIPFGVLYIVVPKGTPLLIGDSLGDIARQISVAPAPAPSRRGQPHQTGTST